MARSLESHAGLAVIQELDSDLFERPGDFGKRIGPRHDRAIKSFHSLHSSQGYP